LFIDEMHTVVGAGGTGGDAGVAGDAADPGEHVRAMREARGVGAAQAERYAEALQSRIGTASEVQQIGRSYDMLRPGLRRLECKAHAIYFRPIPGGIRVLRILHGKMDPGRHLL